MHVWMAMEADAGKTPGRVLMQDRPISGTDLPPGIEGMGWTFRDGDVDPALWEAQLADQLTGEQSDALHRDTWTEAGGDPWPNP